MQKVKRVDIRKAPVHFTKQWKMLCVQILETPLHSNLKQTWNYIPEITNATNGLVATIRRFETIQKQKYK